MKKLLAYKKTIAVVIVALLAGLSAVGYQWQLLDQETVNKIIETLK